MIGQPREDWTVLNGDDPQVVTLMERVQAQRVWFGDNRTNVAAFQLAPETLRTLTESAQAVLQVGRILDIPDPLAWQTIRSLCENSVARKTRPPRQLSPRVIEVLGNEWCLRRF